MRRLLPAICAVLIVLGLGSGGEAGQPHPKKPAGQPPHKAEQQHHGPAAHPHQHQHRSRPYYSRAYRRPHWYFHGFDPYWRPPYPYPYPYPYTPWSWGYPYYYPPPLYIPAEELYGPQAVKRFMGVDRMNPPAPAPRVVIPGAEKANGAGDEKKANRRATNPEALALAWKFIGFGDAHFANQKYVDAYQRYKKATQAAPALAQAYFRQGYALAAQERYELAAKALERGLALDPGWARSKFRSDELYGPNQLAKTAHLDALAKATADKPHDAELVFLLGVFYYFDGQHDRAAPLLERAAQMLGPDNACLNGFLEELK